MRNMNAKTMAVLFFLAAGCSRGPQMGEVEGTIMSNGKPLGGIEVQFLPDPGQGTRGPTSSATTDKNGHYELICEDRQKGAVVGHHRVYLRDLVAELPSDPAEMRDDSNDERPPPSRPPKATKRARVSRIPMGYTDLGTKPLVREVGPGRQTINLDVAPGK